MPANSRYQPLGCLLEGNRWYPKACVPVGGVPGDGPGGMGRQFGQGGTGGSAGGQAGGMRRHPVGKVCDFKAQAYFVLSDMGIRHIFTATNAIGAQERYQAVFPVVGFNAYYIIVAPACGTLADVIAAIEGRQTLADQLCAGGVSIPCSSLNGGGRSSAVPNMCAPIAYGVPPLSEFANDPPGWYFYGAYYLLLQFDICDPAFDLYWSDVCTQNNGVLNLCQFADSNFPFGSQPVGNARHTATAIGTVQWYVPLFGWPQNWDGSPLPGGQVAQIIYDSPLWVKVLNPNWDFTQTGIIAYSVTGQPPGHGSVRLQSSGPYLLGISNQHPSPGYWVANYTETLFYRQLLSCFPPTFDEQTYQNPQAEVTASLQVMFL